MTTAGMNTLLPYRISGALPRSVVVVYHMIRTRHRGDAIRQFGGHRRKAREWGMIGAEEGPALGWRVTIFFFPWVHVDYM